MKIYFLIPNHVDLYDDGLITIAEGLKDLGIEFYANRDYWKTNLNGDYLFNYSDISQYADFDVIILSNNWTQNINSKTFKTHITPLPTWLFDQPRKFKTVYIDNMDGYKTFSYCSEARKFDYILRAKYNNKTLNHANMYPWVLGYQKRIFVEKLNIPIVEKELEIAVNFYFSHSFSHQLRSLAQRKILNKIKNIPFNTFKTENEIPQNPFSKLMWEQTLKKHNPNYYHSIEKSIMNASFCGDMIPGWPLDPSIYLVGGNKAKLKKLFYKLTSTIFHQQQRIIQWDSWRFWETLILGSIPIHIDLEKYGVQLPVMPKNWEHYIGIDLDHIERDLQRIADEPNVIFKIAENGQKWALQNYAPAVSAQRLIDLISN